MRTSTFTYLSQTMARTPAATCAAVYKSVYDVAKGGERQVDERSLTQALAGGAGGALPLASGQVDQVELPNADCPLQNGTVLNVSRISVLPHVCQEVQHNPRLLSYNARHCKGV